MPTEVEWELVRVVCEHLKPFYTMIKMFSGTKYPPTNLFFPIICEIRLSLDAWLNSSCDVIKKYGEKYIRKVWKILGWNPQCDGCCCCIDKRPERLRSYLFVQDFTFSRVTKTIMKKIKYEAFRVLRKINVKDYMFMLQDALLLYFKFHPLDCLLFSAKL